MQVILKEDIASLGYKDDVVTVKDGYGRNYLIPQGLAVIASASALKVLAENKKQRAHKLAKIKADAEAIAAAVAELKVVITAKASENGTIYGGINNAKVSEALAALGQEIDRKKIIVKDTINFLIYDNLFQGSLHLLRFSLQAYEHSHYLCFPIYYRKKHW